MVVPTSMSCKEVHDQCYDKGCKEGWTEACTWKMIGRGKRYVRVFKQRGGGDWDVKTTAEGSLLEILVDVAGSRSCCSLQSVRLGSSARRMDSLSRPRRGRARGGGYEGLWGSIFGFSKVLGPWSLVSYAGTCWNHPCLCCCEDGVISSSLNMDES